jgi:hypothetical protein
MQAITIQVEKLANHTTLSTPDASSDYNYADGSKYTGDVNNGLREGEGSYTFANGDVYEGLFENNLPHGKGKLSFDNGDEYEGGFRNGAIAGFGTYSWLADFNKLRYNGFWENGSLAGKGELEFSSGDVFKGEFAGGVYHGKGVLAYANGDCYDGTYVNGRPVGSGKFLFKDAKVVMNRNFNNQGIDRADTKELKRNTFSLTKKKKKGVKVKMNTFRPKSGKNPNMGIMDGILGSLGAPKRAKSKKSTRQKKGRKVESWTKKISRSKKVAAIKNKRAGVTVKKVKKRKKPRVRKPMDESYLDYVRTNICGTPRRKRLGLKLEHLFDDSEGLKRSKSIVQCLQAARGMFRGMEEEAVEDQAPTGMDQEVAPDSNAQSAKDDGNAAPAQPVVSSFNFGNATVVTQPVATPQASIFASTVVPTASQLIAFDNSIQKKKSAVFDEQLKKSLSQFLCELK